MANSGIKADQGSKDRFAELQGVKKNSEKLKWIIFTINSNKTEITVEKSSRDGDYESFLEEFPETEPRFALYDFDYDLGDAGKRNKIVFFHWNPAIGDGKAKMIFAASKSEFVGSLGSLGANIQADTYDEMSYETVLQKVAKR